MGTWRAEQPRVLQRCRLEAVVLGRAWQGCEGTVAPDTSPVPRFSALHHAALNGNTELISLLLEAQAAVDIKDNKGKSPGPLPCAPCRLCLLRWHMEGSHGRLTWKAHGFLPLQA